MLQMPALETGLGLQGTKTMAKDTESKEQISSDARRSGGRVSPEQSLAGGFARRPPKIAEATALSIVGDIVRQGLSAGDMLPQEAEMLAHYGVSRSSIREALRLLEAQQIIRMRPGPGGGPIVGTSEPQNLIRTLRLHYHFAGATYGDLLSAWLLTEPILAELAAQNPDRELVRELMEPFVGAVADGDVKASGSSFHEAVGQLSGNPVLEIMFRAMAMTMENHIVDAVRQADFDDEIVEEHSELAKAIIDGDSVQARKLMTSHIENITGYFREFLPRIVGETVPPGP